MNRPDPGEASTRAKMSADVDTPDKIIYGLTFRQLAILGGAAFVMFTAWRRLEHLVPVQVLLAAAIPIGAVVFAIAMGRRDGLPLDVWILHGLRYRNTPTALSPSDTHVATPDWVALPATTRVALPAPLKLPADTIDDNGEIHLDGGCAAMVAATTVNLALRTTDEQAALLDTFGRWLNSLTSPTQVLVCAQPVDLQSHARSLADTAGRLPHPALQAACAGHDAFLADLAEHRDPLRRQVLVVTRTTTHERGGHAARRRADDTARALSGLGVTTRTLDGPAVTAALAATADPYRPPRPGGIAAPDTTITGPPTGRRPAGIGKNPRRTR